MAKSKKPVRKRTPRKDQYKRGRASQEEVDFVLTHKSDMKHQEIAFKLNRTLAFVRKIIRDYSAATKTKTVPDGERNGEEFKILMDLRMSPTYEQMKQQFVAEELRFIEHTYLELYQQFQGDVMATERIQIIQAVKIQVLMDRNLNERQRARDDIERLREMLQPIVAEVKAMGGAPTDEQQDEMLRIEDAITSYRSAEHSCTTEFTKLQVEYNKLMDALKATRNQRLEKASSGNVNYVEILKQLQQRDVKEHEGRTLELSKLAAQKERTRLGRPTTFEDGNMDNPLLTEDTIHLAPLPEENKYEDGIPVDGDHNAADTQDDGGDAS